jgi:hypothetical protein
MKRKVVKDRSDDTVECSKLKSNCIYLYKDQHNGISRLYYINNSYVWVSLTDIKIRAIPTAGWEFNNIISALSHILNDFPQYSLYEFDDEKDLREYLKSEL